MSRCAIFCPDDGEFFGGLDLGWTKQLRLARVYADEKTACRTLAEWRRLPDVPTFRLVHIHWRIRNGKGEHVCDRGSLFECRALLDKYARSDDYPGWRQGPYRVMRVATKPREKAKRTTCARSKE